MPNFFEHFTIVSNIAKHISWEDINNFKKLNSLCTEVCEREEFRRCFGILHGYLKFEKSISKAKKRQKLDSENKFSLIKANFQCKNPKLIVIMSNCKERFNLEDVLANQCDPSTTICYIYSKHGNFGSTIIDDSTQLKYNCLFSQKSIGFSWLCLPNEIEAEILMPQSEVKPNTKMVIVLNVNNPTDSYRTKIFREEDDIKEPVYYCGGIVNAIEVFNYRTKCFARREHISIAIGGDNLVVDKCVLYEEHTDSESVLQAFSELKARNDDMVHRMKVKYQCALVFSCYIRRQVEVEHENTVVSEHELFSKYFPTVPISGVLCEGEIFHVNEGVMKLVKSLDYEDIGGTTSIYVLLSWTE